MHLFYIIVYGYMKVFLEQSFYTYFFFLNLIKGTYEHPGNTIFSASNTQRSQLSAFQAHCSQRYRHTKLLVYKNKHFYYIKRPDYRFT